MTLQPMRLDEAERYLDQVVVALHAMTAERKGPVVAVLDFLLGPYPAHPHRSQRPADGRDA